MMFASAFECGVHARGWCLPAEPLPSYIYAAGLLLLLTIVLHGVILVVVQRKPTPTEQKPPTNGVPDPGGNANKEVVVTEPPGSASLVADRRKGVKAFFVGADGRVSTSKLQLVLWTYAIAFAFLMALFQGGFDLIEKTFSSQYLLLLGLPAVGATVSKFITTTKVANGQIDKPPIDDTDTGATAGFTQIVTDDSGNGDIGDFQYFLFNLIALGFFFARIFRHAPDDLPVIPDTLLALTSASAFAYLAKKGVTKDVPILNSVVPAKAPRQATVTVRGVNLVGPSSPPAAKDPTRGILAKFGGVPGAVSKVYATDRTNVAVDCVVPDGTPGQLQLILVTASGVETNSLDFEITTGAAQITGTRPKKIVYATGIPSPQSLVLVGYGFGPGGGSSAVFLDGIELGIPPNGWSDRSVEATLPTDTAIVAALESQSTVSLLDALGRPSNDATVDIKLIP